jgi:V8-like Glu-specific endopeptidase
MTARASFWCWYRSNKTAREIAMHIRIRISENQRHRVLIGWCVFLSLVLIAFASVSPANAAASLGRFKTMPWPSDSRSASAFRTEDLEAGSPAYQETIRVPGAIWLRIQFGACDLGSRSHVVITSLEDGGDQRFDSGSMADYRNRTAFFNGDAVTVELFPAPGEDSVYITIEAIYYGEPGEDEGTAMEDEDPALEELCGSDNRVTTTDPAVGRFVFFDASSNMVAKCTAWIASSGAHLSAGHCFQRTDYGDPDLLEFNVPLSDADGSPNFADPDDQYPIDLTSWVRHENGAGDDYSVFDCNVNSDTGFLPVQGQNDFFRTAKVADITTPSTIRITGYGVDGGTVNRVLQTDTGPYVGQYGSGSIVTVEYQVDTMSGNSGGPVIVYGTETSIGVHTHAGCDPPTGNGNQGTSFENDALESALQNFFGTYVRYVDAYHPIASALENGTVLRPYDTVSEAVAVASSGNHIRIVNGTYSSAADSSLLLGADGKSLLLLAPVGSVTIGP